MWLEFVLPPAAPAYCAVLTVAAVVSLSAADWTGLPARPAALLLLQGSPAPLPRLCRTVDSANSVEIVLTAQPSPAQPSPAGGGERGEHGVVIEL